MVTVNLMFLTPTLSPLQKIKPKYFSYDIYMWEVENEEKPLGEQHNTS